MQLYAKAIAALVSSLIVLFLLDKGLIDETVRLTVEEGLVSLFLAAVVYFVPNRGSGAV